MALQQLSYECPGLHGPGSKQDISRQRFGDLFNAYRQYRLIIPLFQRRYCWNENQFHKWWNDIYRGSRDHLGLHNTGNIVIKPKESTKELIIIDGQQRLTTTFIVLAALRQRLESLGKSTVEIDDWIFSTTSGPNSKLTRLLPSYLDRDAFNQIMLRGTSGENNESTSNQAKAFRFFCEKSLSLNSEDKCLDYVQNSLFKMSMTLVLIRNEIDMPQVFLWLQEKSLFSMGSLLHNPSPGEGLSAPDMIRNLMMACVSNLDMKVQEKFHMEKWLKPIEFRVDDLTDFIVKFNEKVPVSHISSIEKFALDMLKNHSKKSSKALNIIAYGKFYSFYEFRMMEKNKVLKMEDIKSEDLISGSQQILDEMASFAEIYSLKNPATST